MGKESAPQPACPWRFLDSFNDAAVEAVDTEGHHTREENDEQRSGHHIQLGNGVSRRSSYMKKVIGEQQQYVDINALPLPVLNREIPSITLPKAAVDRGKQYCLFALIGRLDFRKISIVRERKIVNMETIRRLEACSYRQWVFHASIGNKG